MNAIEIKFADLHYILSAAKSQLKTWIKNPYFESKEDEIYLNKIENILDEIEKSPSDDFQINELPF